MNAIQNELSNNGCFFFLENVPIENSSKFDEVVSSMVRNGEISEKVSEFLQNGEAKLSKFYHLLKTHNIPIELDKPADWLEENGYPVRGIISCKGAPTEKLAGLVDHFLQPGMKQLPSFLKDTKHTLQVVEDINEKIESGEFS